MNRPGCPRPTAASTSGRKRRRGRPAGPLQPRGRRSRHTAASERRDTPDLVRRHRPGRGPRHLIPGRSRQAGASPPGVPRLRSLPGSAGCCRRGPGVRPQEG
ncbi:hypothetical protein SZ63_09970 [Methanoculleus sediminis]|uniref:Uncharacterized protein n=1 Tax=Methanoculleus sediminis TaxID=1550566 RepID=A0A0H1QXF3_9EURY|nr:hypothetical protein SZ63_09970 [Methanoculleus sediminis]